ncbi:MAG: hypothetical protein QNK37_26155 [Acidobacteriota bacterium]|nr:hypothetical protein [Acidobacteriota bacterium]
MWNWLFGKKSKKKKPSKPQAKNKSGQGLRTQTGNRKKAMSPPSGRTLQTVDKPFPKREDPRELMEKMGGAEELAKVIRTLLAEDKEGRR